MSNSRSDGFSLLAYLLLIGIFAFFASLGACEVPDDRFESTMRNQGYEDSVKEEYDFFECGVGDVWVNGFHAKDKATDLRVDGTVCCGIFKGCTVRWQ